MRRRLSSAGDGAYVVPSTLNHQERIAVQNRINCLVSDSIPVTNLSVLQTKYQVESDAYLASHEFLNTIQTLFECIETLAKNINDDLIYSSCLIQCIPSSPESPKGIPWHQDIGHDVFFGEVVNFIYYPQATSCHNGVFKYVPIQNKPYKLTEGDGFESLPNELEMPSLEGDILVADGRLIHSVSPNHSNTRRLSLVTRYVLPRIRSLSDLNVGVYRNGRFNYKEQREL